MLREHLNQDHDMASRRVEWIDKQVAWIHGTILSRQPSRILDLGCGPGFYAHRLATLGHHCLGIDFGPASIEYANQNNPDVARCEFVLGDVRQVDFGGPHDLVMILFGELNVFSPQEALAILRKVRASLFCGGQLIVELQTPAAVEQSGNAESSESNCEKGLFTDQPHRCRTENEWLDEQQVAVQVFHITEMGTENTCTFRSTTKAWSDDDLQALFSDAGFSGASRCPEWPCNTSNLALWSARRVTS
jgi:ubiquinone/menaquinone biosynthesis C-methylase UbiE